MLSATFSQMLSCFEEVLPEETVDKLLRNPPVEYQLGIIREQGSWDIPLKFF